MRPVALPPESGEARHAHHPFLNGERFDLETRRVLGVALEMTCIALRTGDCDDSVRQAIAIKIIELAKAGERNPDVLCEQALAAISLAAGIKGRLSSRLVRWPRVSAASKAELGLIGTRFSEVACLLLRERDLINAPGDHHFSSAENRRTKSGFSFANADCVTHMRQGFPVQRAFAAPSRNICPAALTASSRAVPRSGSSTPTRSMWVRSSSIWK
jgi:hypothetical protein